MRLAPTITQTARMILAAALLVTGVMRLHIAHAFEYDNQCYGEHLSAGYEKTYTHLFVLGGQGAEVTIEPRSPIQLHILVYDNNNVVIVNYQCDARTSNCILQWTPRWNGYFSVRVINTGSFATYNISFFPWQGPFTDVRGCVNN